MKKFIIKLDVQDGKDKRKALKIVSSVSGIDMISMDMKGKKLTITGTVDPVTVVSKLRKFWRSTDIISVGPAKEPEKKEEPKKEEAKKEEAKKEEPKKEEPKKEEAKGEPKKEEGKEDETKKAEEPKKEGEKKTEQPVLPMVPTVMPFRPYYPPVNTYYPPVNTYYPAVNTYYPPPSTYYNPPPVNTNYYAQPVVEDGPSSCVIC